MSATTLRKSLIVLVDEYLNKVVVMHFEHRNDKVPELAELISRSIPDLEAMAYGSSIIIQMPRHSQFKRYGAAVRNCTAMAFGTNPNFTTLATRPRLCEFNEHQG